MSFDSALSGLNAASSNLNVIGNNIANASTTGFKSSRAEFVDVYAASSLGVSASSAGTGVKVAAITQEFTNGDISSTDRSLDMAINGTGFFVMNQQGSQVFSTNGAFTLNDAGYVVNSSNAILNGYLTDATGNISGALGDLKISNANISPKATSNITVGVNLNSSASVPAAPFQAGFTPNTPPATNTYNSSSQIEVFDSLGTAHIMTSYYCKTAAANTWRVYVGIDGVDVTPTASPTPAGPYPQPFATTAFSQPYTMVFGTDGKFVAHNSSTPSQYYGPGPVESADGSLVNVSSLTSLSLKDLTINGVEIEAPLPTMDQNSPGVGATSSAIAIATAINNTSSKHGVTATVNANNIDLGNFTTGGSGTLSSGMLNINGIQVIGNIGTNTGTQLANLTNLINGVTAQSGISAQIANNTLQLTASDGRNIELTTNGASGGPSFAAFNMNGGTALDQIKHSTYTLATTPTLTSMTLSNYTAGNLTGNNLVINGTPITGTTAHTDDLVGLINAQTANTGVLATRNGNDITLKSSGGRTISVTSDGAATTTSFTNFALSGGAALSQSQSGISADAQLDNQPIIIGGRAPNNAYLTAGPVSGISQATSDNITISGWDPGGGATSPQPLVLDLSGTTAFSADFAIYNQQQDGYQTGGLDGVSVDKTGIITARYTNGQTQTLGQVALANFNSTNNLQPLGGTTWAQTYASGVALIGAPESGNLGHIQSGALESSNVDLTSELVNLIVAQRNFQANAQTIKTEDTVTQTIINLR